MDADANTDGITLIEAYVATRRLVEYFATRHSSGDIETLWFEMEFTTGQHSRDPAYYAEWTELWGVIESRNAIEALRLAVSFVKLERGWSKEEPMLEFIKQLNGIIEKDGDEELWPAWLQCIDDARKESAL